MVTDSRVTPVTLVRRSLEVRPGWRALLAVVPAAIGVALVTRGMASAIAGGLLVACALGLLALPMFSPERVRRRLLAAATERVPDEDGWVTLVGIAREAQDLLTAPYSKRPCVAYWARTVTADTEDESRDAGTDAEQRAASCDFALDVGGMRLMVSAGDAYLAFERSLGEVVTFSGESLAIEMLASSHRGRERQEEIVLRPGDRVVVRGMLVRGTSDAPYRSAARISGKRGRSVAIALGTSDL
jgi:hypothetical protein